MQAIIPSFTDGKCVWSTDIQGTETREGMEHCRDLLTLWLEAGALLREHMPGTGLRERHDKLGQAHACFRWCARAEI